MTISKEEIEYAAAHPRTIGLCSNKVSDMARLLLAAESELARRDALAGEPDTAKILDTPFLDGDSIYWQLVTGLVDQENEQREILAAEIVRAILKAAGLRYQNPDNPTLRDIAERIANNLYAAGYEPKENSNHPWECLLFDAEKALETTAPPAPAVPGPILTDKQIDEQIDAVLDSNSNMAYVIVDKRERLYLFAREILRAAMFANKPVIRCKGENCTSDGVSPHSLKCELEHDRQYWPQGESRCNDCKSNGFTRCPHKRANKEQK